MQYLSRTEAAEFLSGMGLQLAKSTLQKYATVGGGPEFQKFGNRVIYTEECLLQWAQRKLSDPRSSTSEVALNETDNTLNREIGD